MKKGLIVTALLAFMITVAPYSPMAQECLSPALEYYMTSPLYTNCTAVTPGEVFISSVDGMEWMINIVDNAGNPIEAVGAGAPFYMMVTWQGLWGAGYMPHVYIPGDYYGMPLTWKESWEGGAAYTGSAEGDIVGLDDIANRNPITVSEPDAPNLVIKTPNFASATGNNTLVVGQEQVFLGYLDGPWTEPDSEIITWTFGPFTIAEPAEFIFRILINQTYNGDLFVPDYSIFISPLPCFDDDLDGFYQEMAGCAGPYDCNDQDPGINPAACDIKKDGIDQDCDGVDRTNGKQCLADGSNEPALKEGPGKTCEDGIDNDEDGSVDCLDLDCFSKKSCL